MAFQAAKGMHFLHSSGIVHRDLKSLNLLLDNKWNIKVLYGFGTLRYSLVATLIIMIIIHHYDHHQVSDFGLTTFKGNIKRGGAQVAMATVHWTAPEVTLSIVAFAFYIPTSQTSY
jgi:serine/threonine protein kinase